MTGVTCNYKRLRYRRQTARRYARFNFIQWVISLFGLSFRSAETLVYSQAARSKFILIIMGIYMSSNIYYYYWYTKGESNAADETSRLAEV